MPEILDKVNDGLNYLTYKFERPAQHQDLEKPTQTNQPPSHPSLAIENGVLRTQSPDPI